MRGAHDNYLEQLKNKAKKKSTAFVAIADIADFYPRIYQHRLQNVIEATANAQRGFEVARVLVKKLINKLMGGNSYGIPVGPYASRILVVQIKRMSPGQTAENRAESARTAVPSVRFYPLGEAILIDVDAHLQSKGIDYVRWVDDYNIFSRSEYLAQSTIFDLAKWLFTNHGLTLQSSKTKILPVSRYLNEIVSSPDENLTGRDQWVFLLREVAADFEYGEAQAIEDEGMEEKRIEACLSG